MAFIRLYCKGANMTVDHIDAIYQFNEQAGLLEQGYNDFSESAYQIEEALEGFTHLQDLANILTDEEQEDRVRDNPTPKNISRAIVHLAKEGSYDADSTFRISDVDRLDKAIDAIVFAVGSIAKLGLTPTQIREAIEIVTTANLQKLSMPKDEFGKLTKPADFVGPEAKLQELLDRRNA